MSLSADLDAVLANPRPRDVSKPPIATTADAAPVTPLRRAAAADTTTPRRPHKNSLGGLLAQHRERVRSPKNRKVPAAHEQQLATRLVWVAVIGCVACGPIAVGWHLLQAPPQTPMVTEAGPAQIDLAEPSRAADLAQQVVMLWLTASRGTEQELARLVVTDVTQRLPDAPVFAASDPRLASITRVPASAPEAGAPIYSVTVSVTVRPAGGAVGTSARRFFQVPVAVTGPAARAVTLPAEVAAPSQAVAVTLGYDYQPPREHSAVTAALACLSAMLAGDGDIARYLTPGTALAAVSPPPYRSISLITVASTTDLTTNTGTSPTDGASTQLLLTINQQTLAGRDGLTSTYAMRLTARGGRWEVSGLDLAPEGQAKAKSEPAVAPKSSPASTTAPARASSTTAPTTSASAPTPAPTPAAGAPNVDLGPQQNTEER